MLNLLVLLLVLILEAAFGYPDALFRAVRHPVVWMGALIAWLERKMNRPGDPPHRRHALGVVAQAVLLVAVVLPCGLMQFALFRLGDAWAAVPVLALLAATLPAQRSLWSHVRAVALGLERDGLAGGRRAVGMIVGRDTAVLDEAGVVRAAIESLAENFSDGVVAPAFWCGVAGLPGIAGYKAANTADSMVGHRTPRYEQYGWAAARFDDVVNLPASRLAAGWIIAAAALTRGADARGAWRAVRRDAGRHRSPNAGWPEAAIAGALGLRLAGPRVYGSVRVEDGWMGDGCAEAGVADLWRALHLFRLACAVQLCAVAALVLGLALAG
ncbi:adenosylcobinamide-phosphate synthase CbiB [Roseomonas elaeocarpi]|uniref:Cobalamin biosynthesis protein CobD n=1 Tax=Roseomonas elaeocarpi TaxID=907779 RepID=A0ABV6JUH4_9PROT